MRRTRKHVGIVAATLGALGVLAGSSGTVHATLFVYDAFNYTTTAADPSKGLSGTDGAIMGAGGYTASNGNLWYPTSTAFDGGPTGTYHAANDAAIVDGNLTYAGLAQDPSSTSVSYGGPGYSPKVGFTEVLDGTVYYSMLFKVTDLSMPTSPAPAYGGIGLIGGFALGGESAAEGGNPSRVPTLLYVKPTGTTDGTGNRQFTLGVSKSETNPNTSGANPNGAVFGAHVFSEGETIFVVGKYEFVESNGNSDPNDENDNISTIYVNPTPGQSEASAVETLMDAQGIDLGLQSVPAQSQIRGVDAFIFRQGGNSTNAPANPNGVVADELRIGTTWADVTPAAAVTHLPGDTNDDGVVDLTDLNNVLNNFGSTDMGNAGDENHDNVVDLTDLNSVLNNFGATAAAAAGLAVAPEPASAGLVIGSAVALGLRRRRRAR